MKQLKSMLIPLQNTEILLPYSTVSEVIGSQPVSSIQDMPSWILGRIHWRQQEIFLISYEAALQNEPVNQAMVEKRILIIKALGNDPDFQFLALLIGGMPKLVNITPDNLTDVAHTDALHPLISRRVGINNREAVIPNIEELELNVKKSLLEPDTIMT